MSTPTPLRAAIARLPNASRLKHTPPTFLLPSLLASAQQTSSFSSTASSLYPRDNNRQRGVSTQRRTGLRQPLSVSKTPIPKPVLDASKRSKVEVDPDHGLWDFFHSKDKPMNTPEEDNQHGRRWHVEELRSKSWEDLHSLWWVCCKERNRIATERFERRRIEAGYGDHESERREIAVRMTQRGIKQALTERYYSWREAAVLAKYDPEIDLSGKGPLYVPRHFDEDLPVDEEVFEDQDEADAQKEEHAQDETPVNKTDLITATNPDVQAELRPRA